MHDELSAPTTTEDPTADSTGDSTADSTEDSIVCPPDDPSEDRLDRADEPPAAEPAAVRSRDGVDPPDEQVDLPADGDATTSPESGGDRDDDDCDSDDDEEPLEYRLERLRLWRTLATLAVVVARLIRSL
ncbi:MAG: hypothetical protein R6U01_07895 [Halorubrum sp.]|uniref:hypothetical protein n=1 Tax=Halorubrum sp. TaxID=1879286 RepID=UPI0039710092